MIVATPESEVFVFLAPFGRIRHLAFVRLLLDCAFEAELHLLGIISLSFLGYSRHEQICAVFAGYSPEDIYLGVGDDSDGKSNR